MLILSNRNKQTQSVRIFEDFHLFCRLSNATFINVLLKANHNLLNYYPQPLSSNPAVFITYPVKLCDRSWPRRVTTHIWLICKEAGNCTPPTNTYFFFDLDLSRILIFYNNKNYNFLDCDWLKKIIFSLIHLSSCCRTVCYGPVCDRIVCYRTVQQANQFQSCKFKSARALALVFLAPN